MTPDIFIFAGESSGDLHGEKLLSALFCEKPNLTVVGVGGPRMRKQGFTCLMPMEKFQVMGFIDVFLALPRLIWQFYKIRRAILTLKPKVVITIDYPGFNLRLGRSLRKKGFKGKLCHYICPSVWAWGKDRIEVLAKNFDLLLSILPFEQEYFSHTNLAVFYVGHPLMERILNPVQLKKSHQIAIFPGSRTKEIKRNLPLYLKVIRSLSKEYAGLSFVISVAAPKFFPLIQKIMQQENVSAPLVSQEKNEELISNSFLALAKSGTITLELALYGLPTIVTYAMSSFDMFLAKHIFHIHLPYYCLVNILAKKLIFPELIGPALTEKALFTTLKKNITHPEILSLCQQECLGIRKILGHQATNIEAAKHILTLLE
jgi:lipid-A-disaccharide synthase